MPVPKACLDLIKKWEGCRLDCYLDVAGYKTIGYGHRTDSMKVGQRITQHQADVTLESDVERFYTQVEKLVPGANENELSALTAFAFNVGLHRLEISNLLRKFLAGDVRGAAAEFLKFDIAGGKHVQGLHNRRVEEAALFLQPV